MKILQRERREELATSSGTMLNGSTRGRNPSPERLGNISQIRKSLHRNDLKIP